MSRPEKIVRECAKCGVKFMAEKEGRDYQEFCCNCQENGKGRNEKRKGDTEIIS